MVAALVVGIGLIAGFELVRQVVQSEDQERVGVCENAFIYRQRIASLVHALKDCYGVARRFTGSRLKTER